MTDSTARVAALADRTVREAFAAHPDAARFAGAHEYDGVLTDPGRDAVARRTAELDALAAELANVGADGLSADARVDLTTATHLVRRERFRLTELREPHTDPRWALTAADVSSYVSRPYAAAADRAAALCRHLEQLPEHLDAATGLLEDELPGGILRIALDEARGHASFYRDEVRHELGDLPAPDLERRLETAIAAGTDACERFAIMLERRHARDDLVLGPDRFCAMLEAEEGVAETVASLRRRVYPELERLTGLAHEAAAECEAGSLADAFAAVEKDHPAADSLIATAQSMLDRLRDFWMTDGAVGIDPETSCMVRPTPAFLSWATAAYENPGPLDPPGMPHYYYVTPVDPGWSEQQAEEWLRHLNFSSLENASVHEVYPGHFVHAVHGLRNSSLVRSAFWFPGFSEGWAHYAEQLAVEHGLAEGRPFLRLAMIQDAMLRACRFAATLGIHAEGMSLDEATQLFVARAHVPRLPAEREAQRATYDPMYLVYCYGKLEILRWRAELSRRPQFSERAFHDRMLATGFVPLAVVRDRILNDWPVRD